MHIFNINREIKSRAFEDKIIKEKCILYQANLIKKLEESCIEKIRNVTSIKETDENRRIIRILGDSIHLKNFEKMLIKKEKEINDKISSRKIKRYLLILLSVMILYVLVYLFCNFII